MVCGGPEEVTYGLDDVTSHQIKSHHIASHPPVAGSSESQQKCIVIFALVCCFAILVALIFSAVDIVGEDEDGLSEKNCQNKCRIALVENIPEGLNYSENAPFHLSLFQGWMNLLNMAKKSVDIVSSHWDLNHTHPSACQGQRLFEKLLQLTSQDIEIKLVSDVTADSKVLEALKLKGAEVTYMNMTAYNKGRLQSSFWIVDKQHVYIGSAGLDWQSLGQMKELGVIFYNCSCLVLDLQRIFALYSSLKFKSRVPQTWSKRLYGVYDNEKKLQLQLNETKSQAFVSNSPKLFCPKNRSFDIDAIYSVIDDAKQYVYIAVMDYLPISSTSTKRSVSTHPLQGNFDWVGNDFTQNAGTGLVINQADVRNNRSIIKQLKDVFERDWYSPYAKTLQPTKQPNCSSLFKLKPPSNKTASYNTSGKEPLSIQ
uniref:Phospholipase D family member 5 n=1 Tax=Oryctolagus cuniculus TaxID=9986 RepID=G1SWQ6_RABIT